MNDVLHDQSQQQEQKLKSSIAGFLQDILEDWENQNRPSQRTGPGRPVTLPNFVLWISILLCVLQGFTSQLAIWRLIRWTGIGSHGAYAISDQAVYNRLSSGGQEAMQDLFHQITHALAERFAPYAQNQLAKFAAGVYAIDGSTLDKVGRYLPALRKIPDGDSQLLPGKMVGLFDIRSQQWCEMVHLPNPHQNDKVAARELADQLPRGSLLLADLGFFGFAWFDYLTFQGYWWISRWRDKTSFEVVHTFYEDATTFDGLIWLGKYRADKAAFTVRLVRFTVGQTQFQYLTNVLDPWILPLQEIAQLYARRWDIEMAFRMVKQYLKLHLIWSAKQDIILLQVWAVLIISQVLQAIRLEIAGLAEVDPFDVSLPLLVQYVPQLTLENKNPVEMIVRDGRELGFIRPSRRIRIQAPIIAEDQIRPLPEGMKLVRCPRYAKRKGTTSYFPPEFKFWETFQPPTRVPAT